MKFRKAKIKDIPHLTQLNLQLIEDENHRNQLNPRQVKTVGLHTQSPRHKGEDSSLNPYPKGMGFVWVATRF